MAPEQRGADPAGARGRLGRVVASVRFRVTALASLVLLGVLVGTGIALVATQRRALTDQLEESIGQSADTVEAVLLAGRVPAVLPGFGDDDAVAQVVDARGTVVAATANIAGQPPLGPAPSTSTQVLRTADQLPHDRAAYRLLSRSVATPEGPQVIHAGAPTDDIEDSTRVLTTSLTVTAPAVAALLGALVWVLVGRTLRPVEEIRAEVAGMGAQDLHRRVPEPGTGDEIDRLAQTMNAMLERVDGGARRQQRFVADASHELRSPLTRIRTELEVDLAHPQSGDWEATSRSVLEETVGLQRLVDDLLHLARSDAGPGGSSAAAEAVDLDDIVLDAARRLRAAGSVEVDTTGVAAAQVQGDRGQLARAVRNLVDNAARHAETAISLEVGEVAGEAVLTVADDGPGIPPDQHERVFERFTRLDDARSNGTGGAGLGLAIARDIVEGHGGTITIDPDHRPGARFVVAVPLAGAGPAAAGAKPAR